jgi:hypothetical protein
VAQSVGPEVKAITPRRVGGGVGVYDSKLVAKKGLAGGYYIADVYFCGSDGKDFICCV